MTEPSVNVNEAAATLDRLVDQLCSMPVDFSDIPVLPEDLPPGDVKTLGDCGSLAAAGDYRGAWRRLDDIADGASFEACYARGKVLFAQGLYYEAAKWLNRAVIKFSGYGELWFLYGVANYQMGLWSEAFMEWYEAVRVNENHQDARYLMNLASAMIKNTHKHLNPEAEILLPIVHGRGVDVGCGSEKTHPDAIGVDIIPPGEKGGVASQKDRVSMADVEASGDDLHMFEDGQLDYVIARHNIEHYADPLAALMEWRRVLKPGGLAGIVAPDDDEFDTIHADSTHLHVFTRSSLRRMVSLIPGLSVVSMGVSQNKWSFYAIVQKEGGEPYDHGKALNGLLAGYAAARARESIAAGRNAAAAATIKKFLGLTPESAAPADPDALHPTPAWLDAAPRPGTANAKRVAVLGGWPDSEPARAALEWAGYAAEAIPLCEGGSVDWQVEIALRQFAPEFILLNGFHPEAAMAVRDYGSPSLAWVKEPVTDEFVLPDERALSETAVFTEFKSDTSIFEAMGAARVFYQPHPVEAVAEESVVGKGAVALVPPTEKRIYFRIMKRLKASLMDNKVPVKQKNMIFAAIRGMNAIMERFIAGGPLSFAKFLDLTTETPLTQAGVGEVEAYYALTEEAAARQLQQFSETHKVKLAPVPGTGEPWPQAAIAVVRVPASYENSVYPPVAEAMARGMMTLANRCPGLAEEFEEGDQIVFYDNVESLRVELDRHINDDDARRRIAGNGMRAAASRLGAGAALARMIETAEAELRTP